MNYEKIDLTKVSFWTQHGLTWIEPTLDGCPFSGKEFYNRFELLHHYYFKVGMKGKSTFNRKKLKKQKCCICFRSSPQVTFKKVAHIIPESLGNKTFKSFEECDECNSYFGNTFENEIGKYLIRQRIFNGVKGSNSHPKLKLKGGGFATFKEPKGLYLKHPQNISHDLLPDIGSFKVELETIKFRPANAIRSILKSAWLFMNAEERNSFPKILDIIKDNSNKPISFYSFDLTGKIPHPALYIYKSLEASDEISSLIIRFDYFDASFFWTYPDSRKKICFPEIFFYKINDNPGGTLREFEYRPNDIISLSDFWDIQYNGKAEIIDKATPSLKENQSLKKIPCTLKWGGKTLKSELIINRYDYETTSLVISGVELPVIIELTQHHLFNKKEITLIPKYSSVELKVLKKYIYFISQSDVLIEKTLQIDCDFATFKIEDFSIKNLHKEKILTNINLLEKINAQSGKNFRLSTSLKVEDERAIYQLSSLLNQEEFKASNTFFDLYVTKGMLKQILERISKNSSDTSFMMFTPIKITLFKNEFTFDDTCIETNKINNYSINNLKKPYFDDKNNYIEFHLKLFSDEVIIRRDKSFFPTLKK